MPGVYSCCCAGMTLLTERPTVVGRVENVVEKRGFLLFLAVLAVPKGYSGLFLLFLPVLAILSLFSG